MKSCPKCNSNNTKKVKFNWWGGILGAYLADDYNCLNCSFKFKGKQAPALETSSINKIQDTVVTTSSIPDTCPHCKSPNAKKIRLCEWCGNQII